ncbi:C-5 cytosine-specific DNA methylase [Edwardsiella tarda ATCC 23685]|uniref:C-5 cytosine-specific DNA methylase n=1 Tax=Edwardsiella tarda ATCC 23685 TaxID=500638 RepID=D4F0Z0_EDWTA|nr:DNA cytosine methyltransferase [Edwardsiella tarda]EFE24650.1 C-5 cytosine-specific DNA methylase [Edwardsiella tarda ATCC 23685]GAC65013.1 putative methyltransferase [Edwardsiella tarda ATCC 15947 = NBRC 105688]
MGEGAYYNEIDPYAAKWLRNLIAEGHIAPGEVDERSIEDVTPDDLRGFTQCHFFAGIGVWSLALRRAGWPDDLPVWTGSCPCQPFSAAGKGAGVADERHLWPAFFHLILGRGPNVVFGEQVSSKDGLGWLDVVQTDLENAGYASAAADLCAAGVGAPHIRQRLYWVAHANSEQWYGGGDIWPTRRAEPTNDGSTFRMGHSDHSGLERHRNGHQTEGGRVATIRPVTETGQSLRVADADHDRQQPGSGDRRSGGALSQGNDAWRSGEVIGAYPTNGHWRDADWLSCRDGKWRPVEPGAFPLANGITSRVGRLRAYGNAICVPVAEEFIKAYVEAICQ